MPATSRRLAACSSRGLLAVILALLSGGFQLAVAFRVDFLLTPRQHILRRDVADGTVQADVVLSTYYDGKALRTVMNHLRVLAGRLSAPPKRP